MESPGLVDADNMSMLALANKPRCYLNMNKQNKMANILQTAFSNTFSWMKT